MILKNTDDIIITVTNTQTVAGRTDTVTERGRGSCREKRGVCYITYQSGNSRVFIKAERGKVSVKRTGESGADMVYEAGKRTSFNYRTPYGDIAMSVFTEAIDISAEGISFKYVLGSGADEIENCIEITVGR